MSVAVFANPVTPMGVTGYAITTVGVFTYSNLVRVYPASTARPGGGGSREDRESGIGALGALTPKTLSLSDLEAGIGVGSGGLGLGLGLGLGGRGGSEVGLGGEATGSEDGLGGKDQDRSGGRERERVRVPLLGSAR